MPFDIRQFNKRVLLTGAGFSRNWGGRLAREMWEEIFSHPAVQLRPALRMLLVRTPLFEDALTNIDGVTIVERKRIDTMLVEAEFGQLSGLVDPEKAKILNNN